jgi:sacsin
VLDQRNHATKGLFSEGLASAQGPALMAFNDVVFMEDDWKALKAIHDSSKVSDKS